MNILSRAFARSAAIHCKSHDRGAVDINVGRQNGEPLAREARRTLRWIGAPALLECCHGSSTGTLLSSQA
jgi:hypothetical protein